MRLSLKLAPLKDIKNIFAYGSEVNLDTHLEVHVWHGADLAEDRIEISILLILWAQLLELSLYAQCSDV